jgi:hypothetical protein
MPNKHNADRRHHFGKMKFKVRNWASYEAAHGQKIETAGKTASYPILA